MKKWIFVMTLSAVLIGVACSSKDSTPGQGEGKLTLETKMQKASYAMGYNMAQTLKAMSPEIDFPAVIQGVKDVANSKSPRLKRDELVALLTEYQEKFGRRRIQKPAIDKELAEKNRVAEETFLKENAKKPGVKVTASGLQYQVLKAGQGEQPAASDTVKVHYRGTFLDGKQFDSSYDRGEPIEFPLNGVIKGWTEGLQLMKKGAKFKFWIPFNLAYGPAGGRGIPPASTLVFEVELLDITKKGQ